MIEWEWYTDIVVKSVFIHLLLTANYKARQWKGITIDRGQTVVSIKNLAEAVGVTEQQARTALAKLERTGEILKKSTNKFTIITICKFDSYQSPVTNEQQTNNKQITNKQQTNNKQITTPKEYIDNIDIIDNNISDDVVTHARENFSGEVIETETISEEEISNIQRKKGAGCRNDTIRNENLAEWLNSQPTSWKEVVCMQLHVQLSDLPELFLRFQNEVMAQNKSEGENEKEICSHFLNQTRIFLNNKNRKNGRSNNITEGVAETIEWAKQVGRAVEIYRQKADY